MGIPRYCTFCAAKSVEHVLCFSSPDVFNDVACLDSKQMWQLEKVMEPIVTIYTDGGLIKNTKMSDDISRLPDDIGTEG